MYQLPRSPVTLDGFLSTSTTAPRACGVGKLQTKINLTELSFVYVCVQVDTWGSHPGVLTEDAGFDPCPGNDRVTETTDFLGTKEKERTVPQRTVSLTKAPPSYDETKKRQLTQKSCEWRRVRAMRWATEIYRRTDRNVWTDT